MTRITFIHRGTGSAVFAVMMLLASRAALAQSDYEYNDKPPGPFHQPVSPFPVEMGFSQNHSSTAAEGFQRGRAALIQAWGNLQLSESQAEILWEQSRWLNRENDLKLTQALGAKQQMWRDSREAVRKHDEARAAEGKVKLSARRSTVYRETYRLSPAELNLGTGEIHWPAALQTANYQVVRERVNELFRQHVGYGDPQPGTAVEIARCTDQLIRSLKSEIRTLPRDQYFAAQKFLRGLKLEAASQTEAA